MCTISLSALLSYIYWITSHTNLSQAQHEIYKTFTVTFSCIFMAHGSVMTGKRFSHWWSPVDSLNTLRPRQNGRRFPDDIFKCIFLNENVWISIKISLKFVPKGPINNIPALVQIMAWRRSGDKPLSEPMVVNLLTHLCVTQPQWVNKDPMMLSIFVSFVVTLTKL